MIESVDKFFDQFYRMNPNPKIKTIKNNGNKLKPNQKCPCESGKKYKKCCQQELEKIARKRTANTISEKEIKKAK